jgi:hypothetical protein
MPVAGAHGAALMLPAATCGLMAHQLVDDPGWDAGVVQPGGAGMAKVVGAVQVHRLQKGITGGRHGRPAIDGQVQAVDVDRRQVGGAQLPQGAGGGGRTDGPTTGRAQPSGELADAPGAAIAQRPQHASGGWPKARRS